MPHWIVPGLDDSAEPQEHLRAGIFDDAVQVDQIQSVRVDVTRESGEAVTMSDVAADEVLEIELEDGLKQWMRADQFEKDFGQQLRRDRSSDALLVPTQLSFGPRSRSGGWVVKAVRRLKVKLGKEVLGGIDAPGLAASALAGKLEKKAMPEPGFYRWAEPTKLVEVTESEIKTDRSILVFVHGTFSTTKGGFGALANEWAALQKTYGGEIYAIDHHTLVESPIENAVALMSRLPEGARLHLVSHSRGGVVGELVCRGQREGGVPFDPDDLRVIQGDSDDEDDLESRAGQHRALTELNELLKAKRPTVERFIRVAGPGSGSTLVSGRLDRWLSLLVNAMKLVPPLRASVTFDLVSSFALAVIKERMNPRRFPGIEGMLPDSPLTKILNRPDVETKADLTVVSGDFEGTGFWGTLKDWATDLYYRDDNDLVVSARSTYGGMRRSSGGLFFFDRGSEVNHFNYFNENTKTVRKLKDGLSRKDGETAGFQSLAEKRRELAEAQSQKMRGALSRQRDDGNRPVVFVLPGIMGSQLAVGDDRIWASPDDLAAGKLEDLAIGAPGVRTDGLVPSGYADIVANLAATHKVVPFDYDWRRSLQAEAGRLADAVKAELGAHRMPVRLLAHSMGGLLARTMIGLRKDVWSELTARDGGRLVMLGTPTGGSFAIVRVLLGRAKLLRLLALLDFHHSRREVLGIVSRFTGLLELLPRDGEMDFFAPGTWDELESHHAKGWIKPLEDDLREARRVREHLGSDSLDPDHMVYVAGQADSTPVGLEIDESRKGKRRLRFLATARGDGSVPWSTGIPPHVPTWYMNAEHGKLAAHEPAFLALEELLTEGSTSLLSSSPPASRGAEELFEMPDDEVDLYPDELALASAALGFRAAESEKTASDPVKVYVTHDHLAFARHPVVVGHHEDDAIMAAEAVLDHYLDRRLSKRRDLNLYPGKVGTSEVVMIRDDDPEKDPRAGAIVIGLGRVGELIPSHLEDSFARGALQYALQVAEGAKAQSASPQQASMTSLLIGTGFGGLSTGDSVRAILRAVHRANQSLIEADLGAEVRIGELELLEIYSDRALEAAITLKDIVEEPRLRRQFVVEPHIRTGSAGRERLSLNEAASWWHRLRIAKRSEKDPSLSFTVLTERARAEVSLLPDQRGHVERFVQRAVSSTRWNDLLANTLFHLLIPNELKHFASDRRHLVLVLDRDAAGYPWELLHDRSLGDSRPIATNSGLIRQLATDRFRRDVEEGVADTALVVGNPPSHLIDLPGAELEAREVADRLRGEDFLVNSQIRATPESIDTALFAEDYKVLHLSGHGVYNEEFSDSGTKSVVTGMVIGKDLVLTPAQINQMPRIPELVFLNCCHLGRQDVESRPRDDYHLIAANLGTQFIEMGVRAVVAAGWAVDDAAARTFALELYDQMLRGRQFGDAVLAARSATYEQHPNVNTWGAYQCYGDPSYRLRRRGGSGSSRPDPEFVSHDHATVLISEIAQKALVSNKKDKSDQYIEGLKKSLERLRNQVPPSWWTESAKLSEATGDAYAELGLFGEAVECYERAAGAETASVSVRAIERAANLRARHAAALARDGVKDPDPVALIEKSISDLDHLVKISPTAERYSLLGSAYKRQMTVRDRVTKTNLKGMAEAYREAFKRREDAYPLTNWLTAGLATDPPPAIEEIETLIDTATARLEAELEARPNFWTKVTVVDCELIRDLFKGQLHKVWKKRAAEYRKIFETVGSRREIDSVLQQFDFQAQVLKIAKRPEKEQEALSLLREELVGVS